MVPGLERGRTTDLVRGVFPPWSLLATATLLSAAVAGALVALAAIAWRPTGPIIVLGAAHRAPDTPSHLVTGHAQLSLADNGWRPASLALEVATDGASPRLVRLSSRDGFTLTRRVGAGPSTRLRFHLGALAPGPARYLLDVHVTDEGGHPASVTLHEPRIVAGVLSPQGVAIAWAGAVVGMLAWLALPIGATGRRRLAHALRGASPASRAAPLPAMGWGLGAALVLVPAAAVLPVVPLRHETALVHAPLFGLSLLALTVAGRIMRRGLTGAGRYGLAGSKTRWLTGAGRLEAAPERPRWDPVATVLIDLLVGVIGLAVAFAWWSLVLKRLAGVDQVPVWAFPVVAVVTLSAAVRLGRRRTSPAPGFFTARDALVLAAVVFALCAIGGPHLATINAYSSDPDQHVGWTSQVLAHGLVPDRYLGSGLHIDYPLGLHTLAAVVSLFGVLPPGTAVAMLPVLASFVSIALFLVGAGHLLRDPDGWTWREGVVAALGIAAMSVALSSSQFSIWQAYQGTGRLAAGLVQVVPVLVLVSALTGRRRQSGALHRDGLTRVTFILCVAGAVALWLNPGLVPLQAVLSLAALGAFVWCSRLPWRARVRAVAAGLALGGLIAAGALAADPWVHRRVLRAAGTDVSGAAALDRAIAHHNATLGATSCLTWRCIAGALSPSRAIEHARRPWTVLVLGPLDVARGRAPDPLAPGGDAPGRRFPDITNRGYSPHHGRAAITFALVCVGLVVMLTARRARLATVLLVVLLVAASIDVVVAEHAHRLIDPDDPQWKLLPPYISRNGARLLTQAFWATAFGALGFWLLHAGERTAAHRSKRVGGWPVARAARIAGLVAWGALAVWTTADAGRAVWTGMTGLGLPFRHLRPADLRDAAALVEAHVPAGESLLTPARHVYINGRHWLFPDEPPARDLVGPLHLQARRASLFLYQFEHGARVSPFDYLEACKEFEAGRRPLIVTETRARWALEVADRGDTASVPLEGRSLCEHPVRTLFPSMRVEAEKGRVRLYRLWN